MSSLIVPVAVIEKILPHSNAEALENEEPRETRIRSYRVE